MRAGPHCPESTIARTLLRDPRVLVLDEAVAETGTHTSLLAEEGRYAALAA